MDEEQLLWGAVDQLVGLFPDVAANRLAWKEKVFLAQDNYPKLNQAGIAMYWVELAKAGKMKALMHPTLGLLVETVA